MGIGIYWADGPGVTSSPDQRAPRLPSPCGGRHRARERERKAREAETRGGQDGKKAATGFSLSFLQPPRARSLPLSPSRSFQSLELGPLRTAVQTFLIFIGFSGYCSSDLSVANSD